MRPIMDVMSYSEVRNNLKSVMDRVVDDCSEVIVTRRCGKPVVLISLDTWRSLEETEYLLSDPANAAELRASIAELDSGKVAEHDLIEP